MSAHICSFDAVDRVWRKTKYEDLRAAALKAGRFSVFEATANQYAAALFTRLHHDPTIVVEKTLDYPWIGPVRAIESEERK